MHLQRADASYLARLQTKTEDGGFWYLHRMGVQPPTANTPTVLDLYAEGFVVRGAWRVRCPFCGGSQFGDPDTQTRFLCCDCGNAHAGRAWIGVVWPADREQIESALTVRENPNVMHWYPHETPEHLYAENVAHGIHDLTAVPKPYRRLVKLLVEGDRDATKPHRIAAGTIVHPDSEWYPKLHAEVVKTMGKNVSESDLQRALTSYLAGR